MQINLLNMYKLDLQTHMLWDTEKQVILLAQLHSYWFNWIIQAKKVQMQKLREKPATSIATRQCLFHTHESITPFSLQSFFIPTIKILQQYYNSKTILSNSN